MKFRSSPLDPAKLFAAGSRRRGRDGALWRVARASNGAMRWVRIHPVVPLKGHRVLFAPPANCWGGGTVVTVDDAMFEQLHRPPERLLWSEKVHQDQAPWRLYAYIFGRRYPAASYRLLGSHGPFGKVTGFTDLDTRGPRCRGYVDDFHAAFQFPRGFAHWDNRTGLHRLQKAYPFVLFIGETYAFDGGASLYGHWKGPHLDSLVISRNVDRGGLRLPRGR